jgi:HK97 family phage portal protein
MSLLDSVKQIFGFGRTHPEDPMRTWNYYPGFVKGDEIEYLRPEDAMELSVVWACIDAITKAVASCHWGVHLKQGANKLEQPDDPLDYVLNIRPNPEINAISWREAVMYPALTWGNSYSEIQKDGRGQVTALWPLYPDRVIVRRDVETRELYYQYSNFDGGIVRLEAKDVFHIRGPSVHGLMGDNFVARASKSIGLAFAIQGFSNSYFNNNTVVGSVLEYPKVLDDKGYERLKKEWDEKRKGYQNAHKALILEGGMKIASVSHNAEQAQLIDARKFQIEDICRWWGVPPHKIQHLERATYNNIEHLGLEFVRDALTPWAHRLQQEADYKLFPPRQIGVKRTHLDMGWLSQGDFKSRMEGYQMARRMGVYSTNDIRRKEGENSIGPEGDVYIVETNMQPLDMVEETAQANITAKKQPKALPNGASTDSTNDTIQEENIGPANQIVKEAVVALFASAIDRYAKRLQAREKDLRKHAKRASVETLMAEERIKLRPWLLDECGNALQLLEKLGIKDDTTAILSAVDDVDNGVQPQLVAEHLVTHLLEAHNENAASL